MIPRPHDRELNRRITFITIRLLSALGTSVVSTALMVSDYDLVDWPWSDVVAAWMVAADVFILAMIALDVFRTRNTRSFWSLAIVPASLVSVLVAARVATPGTGQNALLATAGVMLAVALGLRAWRFSRSAGQARKVELRLAIAMGGVLVAMALYAFDMLGSSAQPAAEEAEGTVAWLTVIWPALLAVSLGALLFMEAAARGMSVEEAVELRRVDAAATNGLTLGLAIIFVVSINYVAQKNEWTRDLSYLRTTEPSENTIRMVRALDEPVTVYLFFPRVSDVLDQARPYFDAVDRQSEHVTVRVRDHALEPQLAQRHRVRGNGHVLIVRGDGESQQAKTFEIGLDLEAARTRLRTLDGRFQQNFAELTTRPRELYLTAGHRERATTGADGDPEAQRISLLNQGLERNNIDSRELGMAQGLANRVPEGARAVAVIGPRDPFLREEAQSLLEYVRTGGRLVVFVDPDVDHGLDPLLHGLGLQLRRGVLNSTTQHMRRSDPVSDREVIISNSYSAHPTVSRANRYRRRLASIFIRGGAIERYEGAGQLAGLNVTFPIWAADQYWLDENDDHERNGDEVGSGRFQMLAAVTVPNQGGDEGRAVVIADGDFITDQVLENPGNGLVLEDVLQWLLGEERVFAPTATEEDRPIQHTREEDQIWFWLTSLAIPLPLVFLGAWMGTRRYLAPRRGDPRRPRTAPSPKAPQPKPTDEKKPEAVQPAKRARDEEEEEEEEDEEEDSDSDGDEDEEDDKPAGRRS
jgi:hypothetical protein